MTLTAANAGAAEIISVYFEDGQSRPALVNMGIRKGLWSYAERFEAAFRAHSGTGIVRVPWADS